MDTILTIDSDIKQGIKTKSIKMKKPEISEKDGGSVATPSAVIYKLRDINTELVRAWEDAFKERENVHISQGDIFKNAPAADAIVSPANSFGFMDGGIDMAYSRHFGWQLMNRLQETIMTEKNGELLVGDAVIIPTCGQSYWGKTELTSWDSCNQGTPIKFLISAPTMRIPENVSNTVNAYLAFRAVILAIQKHNKESPKSGLAPIHSVLCPGLATNVGKMPPQKNAKQLKHAYDIYELGEMEYLRNPESLGVVWEHHRYLASDIYSEFEISDTF